MSQSSKQRTGGSSNGKATTGSSGVSNNQNEEQQPSVIGYETPEDLQVLVDEVSGSVSRYCRKRPFAASLAVFLAGVYVGWRVKPW